MTAVGVRRGKAAFSSGCKAHPANAPAGSNRSSHGGNEVAEAFGIACRELVSLDFGFGSTRDEPHPFPERPHLGVQLTKIQKSGHWIFNVGC
jgi:hypothetical protein